MKVLNVLGRGRSGSTILANVLGELDGYFSAGEVRYLFDPVLTRNASCACGKTLGACEVWAEVLAALENIDLSEAAALQCSIVRERNLPRLLRWRPGTWDAADRFAAIMDRVYTGIGESTRARVIVDSSKRPSYAAFLFNLPKVDPYYVHLVRDPRASAYSWRHRRYVSVRGEGEEVTRRNAFDATLRWDLLNVGAEAVSRKAGPGRALTLRYEEFAAEPRAVAERIARFAGEVPTAWPFVDGRTVELGPNHTIAGNPSRHRTGTLVIEDHAEWATKQTPADRGIATAVAAPLLRRYGYRFRMGRSS